MTLNRNREILIFRDKQIQFCQRAGQWHFLTHEPVLIQMGTPHSLEVRRAVYETSLDASFARTGACIGIASSSFVGKVSDYVSKDDQLRSYTIKSRTIGKIIAGKPFHELDRRIRQELVAIDGATVLSHDGSVLAVGAILKIPPGSTGGGRLAAARALSNLGLGIKVSQDGRISGFRPKRSDPVFQIM